MQIFVCYSSIREVNEVYYCDMLLSQSLLLAIHHVSSDFILQPDDAPAHRCDDDDVDEVKDLLL